MESAADLRRELHAAILNVRRQIELQEAARSYRATIGFQRSGGARVLDDLRAELAQLEEALDNLQTERPPPPSPPLT